MFRSSPVCKSSLITGGSQGGHNFSMKKCHTFKSGCSESEKILQPLLESTTENPPNLLVNQNVLFLF